MSSGAGIPAKDASDAITPANSTSLRPESNGTRPGPGFVRKSGKRNKFDFAYPSNPWKMYGFRTCGNGALHN